MIKILNISRQHFVPKLRPVFNTTSKLSYFATTSDPYYILGVDKKDEFIEIKKVFFKLANQYHPDKNQTAEAAKKFLIVKQAFQAIKIERGLMKPVNFVDTTSYQSSRPNANQFNTDQEQFTKNNRDYRVFRQKAQSNAQYSQFNSSFKTIHDINDIKIKVEEGQMKDHSDRFHMQDFKTIIKFLPQSSLSYIIIGFAGIFLIYLLIDNVLTQVDETTRTQSIVKKSQQHQRRGVSRQSVKDQHIKMQFQRMKQSRQVKNYQNKDQLIQAKTAKDMGLLLLKKSQKQSFKISNEY